MKRYCLLLLAMSALYFPSALAQTSAQSSTSNSPTTAQEMPKPEVTILRELHGVKLDMPRDAVQSLFRKPSQTTKQTDEFKIEGGDILTIHYGPTGLVTVIQLYCTDTKRAPAWAEVLGDAQVQEQPNGARFGRKVVGDEKFWVTMYQSKSGEVTTITISRQTS